VMAFGVFGSRRTARGLICWLLVLVAGLGWSSRLPADEPQYLTGRFLVATPEMPDPRFVQTVIYMLRHDATGAMGLVVNRPMVRGPIGELLKGFGAESEGAEGEVLVHLGGPVDVRQGFVLHSDDYLLSGSEVVADGIAVTADVEMLRLVGQGKGPRHALFLLGYAGWAPGQLEGEIRANGWFTIPGDKALLFGGGADKMWQRAMARRQLRL